MLGRLKYQQRLQTLLPVYKVHRWVKYWICDRPRSAHFQILSSQKVFTSGNSMSLSIRLLFPLYLFLYFSKYTLAHFLSSDTNATNDGICTNSKCFLILVNIIDIKITFIFMPNWPDSVWISIHSTICKFINKKFVST